MAWWKETGKSVVEMAQIVIQQLGQHNDSI
jgi:hypothetical protein